MWYCYDKGVILRHNKENLSANLDNTDDFILFLHLFDNNRMSDRLQ